jgi:hypothetical protein
MFTRLRRSIIGLAMGVSASAMAADTMPGSEFQEHTWTGAAYSDRGVFAYCAIFAIYDGTQLLFGLRANFDFFMIGMSNPNWSLPSDSEVFATMSIDGKWSDKYRGFVINNKQVTFSFKPDPAFVRAVAAGRQLVVATPKQTWSFNLVGTEKSIPALLRCVSEHSGDRNPFETAPPKNPFS